MSLKNDISDQIITYRYEKEYQRFIFAIFKHMADYKKSKLGISLSGTYKGREYPHILPRRLKMENLLPCCRNVFNKKDRPRITLHRCFHHLNSSQAMCLNFFMPIINSDLLKVILPDELANGGFVIMPETAVFEMPSQVDSFRGETPTTFDFFVQGKNQKGRIINLFIEVKYTEQGFGKTQDGWRRQEKIRHLYLPLAQSNRVINSDWLDEGHFRRNYQILRNLVHIKDDSYVIFIYPKANALIAKEAENARDKILSENFKTHLSLQTWEEVIAKLANFPELVKFHDHYAEFINKYLPWLKDDFNHNE